MNDELIDSMNSPHQRRVIARSVDELLSQKDAPDLARFRRMYEIQRLHSVGLRMSDRGWAETFAAMRVPRELVEHQSLVAIRDLKLGHEAIFNALRARRVASPEGVSAAALVDRERDSIGCQWCDFNGWHVRQTGLWVDDFGEIESPDGRVCARPNWARQAPISGIVFGDEKMHNLLKLSRDEFVTVFDTAEQYMLRALQSRPEARYLMIFINGGPKSAASVSHAHAQVVGREDRHFTYPETIVARCSDDHWERVREVHHDVGLTVSRNECVAWANIAPLKDADISAVSPTIHDGAVFLYDLLQILFAQGLNCFSLAAIPSPNYVPGGERSGRFSKWPAVVWRLVDRGDMRARHSDLGCMELFGSAVVALDPFLVARWLNEDIV